MIMIRLMLMIGIFVFKSSFAQFENTDIGARAAGLNGAFTSLSNNSLAIFYNPAGLGQLHYRELSAFYSPSTLGVNEIRSAAISYAEPSGIGTFGLGIKTFGFELYRESNFILSYGNNYRSRIFYGLNLNVYHLKIQNYNSAVSYGADFGAIAYMTDFLRWGFFTKNFTGAKIGSSGEKLAQVYRTGFTIEPRSDLSLIIEFEKDVRHPVSARCGMEYTINDFVEIRAGIGTKPATYSAGISINYNFLEIEYALNNFQGIGFTNQGSLTFNFGGAKARDLAKHQLTNAFK